MSADPILYCLERVSDYRDFERLCSVLLAGAGYPGIDPFGGTGEHDHRSLTSLLEVLIVNHCRTLGLSPEHFAKESRQ